MKQERMFTHKVHARMYFSRVTGKHFQVRVSVPITSDNVIAGAIKHVADSLDVSADTCTCNFQTLTIMTRRASTDLFPAIVVMLQSNY